jgi:multiple antibiotic resistance protein
MRTKSAVRLISTMTLILIITLYLAQSNTMLLFSGLHAYENSSSISSNGNIFTLHNLLLYLSLSEESLVDLINTFSNSLQTLFSISDTFGDDLLKSIVALFVVIDPIGTIPLFFAITKKMGKGEWKAVSKITIITAGLLLIVFAIAGTQILELFGITIFSFMIAGGVLLFIVSIELLTHGEWRFGGTVEGKSGVVPLAFPLLAGPGAITSVMISFQTVGLVVTLLSILIVISITYVILRLVNPIYGVLGRRGSMIITRVFAILIAAIAVQYIVDGIKQLFT